MDAIARWTLNCCPARETCRSVSIAITEATTTNIINVYLRNGNAGEVGYTCRAVDAITRNALNLQNYTLFSGATSLQYAAVTLVATVASAVLLLL